MQEKYRRLLNIILLISMGIFIYYIQTSSYKKGMNMALAVSIDTSIQYHNDVTKCLNSRDLECLKALQTKRRRDLLNLSERVNKRKELETKFKPMLN